MDGKKIKIKKKEKAERQKLISFLGTAGLVLLLLLLVFLYVNYYFLGGRIRTYIQGKQPITMLLVGKDDTGRAPKTDTLLIAVYNPSSHRFGVVAVPRDLKARVNTRVGYQTLKINGVYARYGIGELKRALRDLTGLSIRFHAALDLPSLVKIIDLIGGVEVYIDEPMRYRDRAGNLAIDLPAGIVRCDGLKAMEFIRFRSDEKGDFGRMDRQYEFLLNFMKSAVHKNNLLLNLKLLKVLFAYLETNLTFSDIVNLIKHSSNADFNNIDVIRVPGKFVTLYGSDYIEADPEQTRKIIGRFLYSIALHKPDFAPEEIKVAVFNGSGKGGVAKMVRDKLVRLGFNVIEFGNAPLQNHENSLVLNVSGNMKKAMRVAQALRCGGIYTKINNFLLIDVTVIVGRDYEKLL